MHRTERILIKSLDTNFRAVDYLCRQAKTVYNCANYLARQSFFDGELLHWTKLDANIRAGAHRHAAYSLIPNAMSQAVIKRLGDDWKGYFAALKSWKKSPELMNYPHLNRRLQVGNTVVNCSSRRI